MKSVKNIFFTLSILAGTLFSLGGCSTSLEDYAETTPQMDLFEFFEGNTKAWGMVLDLKGKQIQRFSVDIVGTVLDDKTIKLYEEFSYHQDNDQVRTWIITKDGANTFSGTAGDVVGEAKGKFVGNALQWQYTFRLETEKGPVDLKVDDWMYLQDENHMFNISTMTKFGVKVAEVHLFFQKQESSSTQVENFKSQNIFKNLDQGSLIRSALTLEESQLKRQKVYDF